MRDPLNIDFDILCDRRHQIGKLVDDDNDLGKFFFALFEVLVILGDLAHVDPLAHLLFKQSVTAFHLVHRPGKRGDDLLFLGDDLADHEMRDPFVNAELDFFGVDENEPQIFG